MGVISVWDAVMAAGRAGFSKSSLITIVAIAEAEATHTGGGLQTDSFKAGHYGILQFDPNTIKGTDAPAKHNLDPIGCANNPQCAMDAAYQLSKGGKDFTAWQSYTGSGIGAPTYTKWTQNVVDTIKQNLSSAAGGSGLGNVGTLPGDTWAWLTNGNQLIPGVNWGLPSLGDVAGGAASGAASAVISGVGSSVASGLASAGRATLPYIVIGGAMLLALLFLFKELEGTATRGYQR